MTYGMKDFNRGLGELVDEFGRQGRQQTQRQNLELIQYVLYNIKIIRYNIWVKHQPIKYFCLTHRGETNWWRGMFYVNRYIYHAPNVIHVSSVAGRICAAPNLLHSRKSTGRESFTQLATDRTGFFIHDRNPDTG